MSLSTLLPPDLPWTGHQAFLLLDGATASDLPRRLSTLAPRVASLALYGFPPFNALRDISPLLVAVQQPDDPIFRFFLKHAHEEWGVLLFSASPAHAVLQHLRKLLTVELPQGPQVMLRVADAAVLQALFASGEPYLFGPLSDVVIPDTVSVTWHRHQPRRLQHLDMPTPYRLSHEQNEAMDRVDRRRALLELDAHLLSYFPHRNDGNSLAERWPMLERLHVEACAMGLSSQSELLYYANVMASLDGSPLDQHPHIASLLQTPSLQPPSERVALAAQLAHQWAIQRGRP
jgi:hypothetical protein